MKLNLTQFNKSEKIRGSKNFLSFYEQSEILKEQINNNIHSLQEYSQTENKIINNLKNQYKLNYEPSLKKKKKRKILKNIYQK